MHLVVDRAPRSLPRWWRWPAFGAAGLVCVGVVVAMLMRQADGAACAAMSQGPPVVGASYGGKATFYDSGGGGGNCSFPSAPADRMYVALGPDEYAAGASCGSYLDVTGPKGTVRVVVMDQCPECGVGHIDLSGEAFARIATPSQGVVNVTFRAVRDPAVPAPLAFRVKDGASQYWMALQVLNHGNRLTGVQMRSASKGWQTLTRTDYNYWIYEPGMGAGPYTARLTDVTGRTVEVGGIALAPAKVQQTSVSMYSGAPAPQAAPPSSAAPRPASPSPSPSRSPTLSASPSMSPSPSPSARLAEATSTPVKRAATKDTCG